MDPPAANDAPGPGGSLRIQAPPHAGASISAAAGAPTSIGRHALHPPLEPPPFAPATIRKCIGSTVRIQDEERAQEVLILTTVHTSVEHMLKTTDPYSAQSPNGEGSDVEMEDCGSSSSDFTSSSEEFTSSDEGESDGGDGSLGKSDNVNSQDMMSHDGSSVDDDEEVRNGTTQCNGNGAGPRPSQGFRMRAFWLSRRPLCENRHGAFTTHVYYAKVLEKADYNWVATDEEVAVKAVSWECIRACRHRLSEDFLKEIAALQYISDWHEARKGGEAQSNDHHNHNGEQRKSGYLDSHVLAADAIMSSESHLYIVMPYCAGGDMCQRVAEKDESRFTEDEARLWFRQILKGLETLQAMRICHRDLSPENLIILDDKTLVIDFGMCLRIPYSSDGMHLIAPKTPCGKLPHMSAELYRKLPFDGHAVDIWAAGTILLFMLTGKRLQNPPLVDRAFDSIDLGLSYEAMDLLRKMFRLDPVNRLSLEQIKAHPFVTHEFLCQR